MAAFDYCHFFSIRERVGEHVVVVKLRMKVKWRS